MQKAVSFPKVMKSITVVTFVATAVFALLYRFSNIGWLLDGAITAGTTFYHFAMRLLVGAIVLSCVKNPMKSRWFQQKSFEPKLYDKLKVKHWKDRMPTYDPASFSLKENSLAQIVDNCCVSEAVHEVIMLFSFVPLSFSLIWGAFPVFLITSILSALVDGCFAVIQRYNRPRLVRILAKKEASARE